MIKQLEVEENLALEKRLMFLERTALAARQQDLFDNYRDLKFKQSKMAELQVASEQQRMEMQRDRKASVKFIKDNYLN